MTSSFRFHIIRTMEELTKDEQEEVADFLESLPEADKADNTGNPHATGRMICIWRKTYDEWKLKKEVENRMTVKPRTGQMAVTPPTGAPNCPDHITLQMRYDPTSGKFVCPDKDCKVVASPKTTKASLEGVVLVGEFELVKKGDQYFIHLPEQSVMIDVNPILEPLSTGERHGSEGEWHLGLKFPGVRELEEDK